MQLALGVTMNELERAEELGEVVCGHIDRHFTAALNAITPAEREDLAAIAIQVEWLDDAGQDATARLVFATKSQLEPVVASGVDELSARFNPLQWPTSKQAWMWNETEYSPPSELKEMWSCFDGNEDAVAPIFCQMCMMAAREARSRITWLKDELPVFLDLPENPVFAGEMTAIASSKEVADQFYEWATKDIPDAPLYDESLTQDASHLTCHEKHFVNLDDHLQWVEARWQELEKKGPLHLMPLKYSYAEGDWVDEVRFYAALYPADAFDDFIHFTLFGTYIASIEQAIIEEFDDPEEWFSPDELADVIERRREAFDGARFLIGEDVRKVLSSWPLPQEFDWITQLTFIEGNGFSSHNQAEMKARCEEGYLCFFVVQ